MGRAAARASCPHESTSEEEALCETMWNPDGGTTLEREARAHAARRVARAGGADRYCNAPTVAANKSWLHSSDFRADTVIDRAAARGSRRRPTSYGLWGLTTFAELSSHLARPDAEPERAADAAAVTADGAPIPLPEGAAGARIFSRVPFAVQPSPDAATLYSFARCLACGIAKEDARDLCWNAACAALGAAAVRVDAPRDSLLPECSRPSLLPDWSLSKRDAAPRISPLSPSLSISIPSIAALKEPASERIVAATVDLSSKASGSTAAAPRSATTSDVGALTGIFEKSQRSRAALSLYYNLSANATARKTFFPPAVLGQRESNPQPLAPPPAFPAWRPRARSELLAAAARAEAAASTEGDDYSRGASVDAHRAPRRRITTSFAGLRNKRELASLLDEVDRAAALQTKIYHHGALIPGLQRM
jgi:hypothetical protein